MSFRVIITKETGKYFIGKGYNDKKYKILKNQFSSKFKVGNDCDFYAKEEKGFLCSILTPISDEEAGVIMR